MRKEPQVMMIVIINLWERAHVPSLVIGNVRLQKLGLLIEKFGWMFETWSRVFETNSLSSLFVCLNHGIVAVWNVARCWTYGAFYKLDSYKSFLTKNKAEPKNEAKLVRVFEVLTKNQKLGWELKKLRQAFKALSDACAITLPMLSQ